MTIKTQGGKIITKNGKVSCECCEEPECCMYPAQALVDELYSVDDLPDEIIGGGTTYNKLNPPENSSVGLAYYIANNSQPLGTGDEDVIIITDDNWIRWTGGSIGGPGQCLINSLDGEPEGISERFEDQFADTYTVTITGPIPTQIVSLNRVSLCLWEGIGPGGSIWSISYVSEDQEPNFLYRWLLDANGALRFKQGPSNTPAGNYDTAYVEEVSVVVS